MKRNKCGEMSVRGEGRKQEMEGEGGGERPIRRGERENANNQEPPPLSHTV